MKNKDKQSKRLELDQEVVADLDPSKNETTAIKGGAKTNGCTMTLSPS